MYATRMTLPVALLFALVAQSTALSPDIALPVLPPEQHIEEDPASGAKLTYITSNPAADHNLYFHERSWTADGRIILFTSARENGGLMAYIVRTGELLPLGHALGGLRGATAAIQGCGLYALRGTEVLHVELAVKTDGAPTEARARLRRIATLPEARVTTSLNENCDGTRLSVGLEGGASGSMPRIYSIDIASGKQSEVCMAINSVHTGIQHVQWSHTDPNVLSYAGQKPRLMVVDIRTGAPRALYPEWKDELVTHESWWVNDQIIFCGGTKPAPTENSHVKLLDTRTGLVRIIGAGSWWAEATPEAVSRYNWWHADGSDNGRWIVADNWHGDIALFEGKTGRPRLLTGNHRTYGEGAHPHVGFDREGRAVVFVSHKNGNPDVCVASIPDGWQRENPS